jgi:hypothetical protein
VKHENWNLPLNRQEVETEASWFLGCTKMIWLEPMYDELTGHLDMFFKVVDPVTLLVGSYEPADHPINATILDKNAAILAAETNAQGQSLAVHRIPMPPPTPVAPNPNPVFRTYVNSLQVNDLLLIPVYPLEDAYEAEAVAVYQQLYPGKTLELIDSEEVTRLGGAIHCIARTRPNGTLAPTGPDPAYECGGAFTCSSGCGSLDDMGSCSGLSYLARCTGGEPVLTECRDGLFCGFDPSTERFDCVSLGCDSITTDGTCLTAGGSDLAVWCRELSAANHVVQAERCETDQVCRPDTTAGRMACLPPCIDECAQDEVGCSADLTERWFCREDRTGSGCMVRVFELCPAGIDCRNGYCCDDTCVPGETGCWPGGRGLWVCGPAHDATPCYERTFVACSGGTRCEDATCVKARSSKACHCRALGSHDPAGRLPASLLLLLFALWAVSYGSSIKNKRRRKP